MKMYQKLFSVILWNIIIFQGMACSELVMITPPPPPVSAKEPSKNTGENEGEILMATKSTQKTITKLVANITILVIAVYVMMLVNTIIGSLIITGVTAVIVGMIATHALNHINKK